MKKRSPQSMPWTRATLPLAFVPGVLLAVLHVTFIVTHLYDWYIWWLDIPMHLLGGAAVAWCAWVILKYLQGVKLIPKLPLWFVVFIGVFGTVATVGVFWEFSEFLTDVRTASELQGGVADTMKDLANDLLGGLLLALFLRTLEVRGKK